ncbi:hypothetical protein PG993_007218, partial [Apiospora rasikravindrae]
MATDRQTARDQRDGDGMPQQLANEAYTVGWICAIYTEHVAARAFLDEEHESPEYSAQHDNNSYTLGRMGKHNVVIAVLPDGEYGTTSAATVARDMLHSFPNVRIGLMVGIGGGAPSAKNDIRLGDVVVSAPRDGRGGVFQYDFGKTIQDQTFRETGFLAQPPTVLRTAISGIKARYESDGHTIQEAIDTALQSKPKLRKRYRRPDDSTDHLYRTDVTHPVNNDASCITLYSADTSALILRQERDDDDDNPAVHYGLIASANQLMKDAVLRDKLAQGKDVLCFEMEAAGLMNHFPCLVIRGICDYADTHKNKEWQGYAAMTAAAYAKDILKLIAPNKVETEQRLSEVLAHVSSQVSEAMDHVARTRIILDNEADLKILNWLTPTDYGPHHSDYLRRRQIGTGQWLLNSDEYQTWLSTRQQTLFCPGMPGAGKTILTSAVIDDLEHRCGDDNTPAIAYIYFNYKQTDDQKIEDLIASLLKQLAHVRPSLPVAIKQLYHRHSHKRTKPTLGELTQALHSVVFEHGKEHTRVFILVDALDECQTTDGCRAHFLSTLFDLQAQSKVNIFATSRAIPDISERFEGNPCLEVRASDVDIRRYLEGHIAQLGAVLTEDSDLKKYGHHQFLLAQLYFESLQGKDTPRAIRKALRGMVSGAQSGNAYSAAYVNAMERIDGQLAGRAERAKQVLAWITCAKQQLHQDELLHALGVDLEELVLDRENCPRIESLVSVCAGLVTTDERSGIVRLVHYTAQEYFESQKAHLFPEIEQQVTAICTTYLSFDAFATGPCETDDEFEKRLAEHRLYGYAARNWGKHARATDADDEVLSFLSRQAHLEAANQAFLASDGSFKYEGYSQKVRDRTALHLAALFGLVRVVVHLIGDHQNIDAKDSHGETPLHLASEEGHYEVVRVLLEKGADVMATSVYGRTPLHMAPTLEVAKLLIEKGADVRAVSRLGEMPVPSVSDSVLSKKLVEKGIDLKALVNHGGTPLHLASTPEVAKLLIGNGADVNAADDHRLTPLHLASDPEVARQLIEKGADVMAATTDGSTPLHSVSGKDCTDLAQLLMESGADINAADDHGWTPLHLASSKDHTDVAKLLMKSGADIMAAASDGATPLHISLQCGHMNVTRLFLNEDTGSGREDNLRRSPLFYAVLRGLEAFNLLHGREMDMNKTDYYGSTLLSVAVRFGHEALVDQLLTIPGIDCTLQDNFGRSALWWARKQGYASIAERLLEHAITRGLDIGIAEMEKSQPAEFADRQ